MEPVQNSDYRHLYSVRNSDIFNTNITGVETISFPVSWLYMFNGVQHLLLLTNFLLPILFKYGETGWFYHAELSEFYQYRNARDKVKTLTGFTSKLKTLCDMGFLYKETPRNPIMTICTKDFACGKIIDGKLTENPLIGNPDYVTVPMCVVLDRRIINSAFLTYCNICVHETLSCTTLVKKSLMTRYKIEDGLRSLREAGYIYDTQLCFDGGRESIWNFTFNMIPDSLKAVSTLHKNGENQYYTFDLQEALHRHQLLFDMDSSKLERYSICYVDLSHITQKYPSDKKRQRRQARRIVEERDYRGRDMREVVFEYLYNEYNGDEDKVRQGFKKFTKSPHYYLDKIDGLTYWEANRMARIYGVPYSDIYWLRSSIKYRLSQQVTTEYNDLKKSVLAVGTNHCKQPSKTELAKFDKFFRNYLKKYSDKGDWVVFTSGGRMFVYDQKVADQERSACRFIAEQSLQTPDDYISKYPVAKKLEEWEKTNTMTLIKEQKDAVSKVFSSYLTMVTGGPGRGKTAILGALTALLDDCGVKYLLAAPTGKAAMNIKQVSGRTARTVDSTFNYITSKTQLLIVDEAANLSTEKLVRLAEVATSKNCNLRLLLLGDANQLPPVDGGDFFHALVNISGMNCVVLTHNFRQAKEGSLISNAERILDGEEPKWSDDCMFIETKDEEETISKISELAQELQKSGANFSVLASTKDNTCGVNILNKRIQRDMNPRSGSRNEATYNGTTFRVGDKVMHTDFNDYNLSWISEFKGGQGVYNGTTGVITGINNRGCITIKDVFGREIEYNRERLEKGMLTLSYAMTIHKAQGSEYDTVIIPVLGDGMSNATRNSIYTALTRAKKKVIFVGCKADFNIALSKKTHHDRLVWFIKIWEEVKRAIEEAKNSKAQCA